MNKCKYCGLNHVKYDNYNYSYDDNNDISTWMSLKKKKTFNASEMFGVLYGLYSNYKPDDDLFDTTISINSANGKYDKSVYKKIKIISYQTKFIDTNLSQINKYETTLYIKAELFEYFRVQASKGKLDFWDLFILEKEHDMKLICQSDCDNALPTDKVIMQITI